MFSLDQTMPFSSGKKYLLWIMGTLLPQLTIISCKVEKQKENDRPNIIVIISDDTGWNDVGYNGSEILTPVIDNMAKEGIQFDRFYVHSVCSPTRASLLTGRYPSRYDINGALGDAPGLFAGTVTIAELLRQNGYLTAISGKWHLGAVPEARPMQYGFTSSYGYLRGQIDPLTHLYKDGQRTWHRNDKLIDEEGHATDLITNETIRCIKEGHKQNKPFFIYTAFSVPHYPLDEPEEWTNPYSESISNKSRRLFAASMTHMDHGIGQILSTLKELGIEEQTLVVYLSDNGGQRQWVSETEYGGKFDFHDVLGDNTPLRDWKGSIFDGAIRVPAVMIWPGKISHRKVTQNVNVADILPTLTWIAGIEVPEELDIDGINFWPAVTGEKLPENRKMYWKRGPGSFALIKGKWKLISNGSPSSKQVRTTLYDIINDPSEEQDITQEYPDIVEEMKQELLTEIEKDSVSWKKFNAPLMPD
jgi:arylsulfatase B